MALSKNARELYECLPEDGSPLSGGNLKWELEIDAKDFRLAKAELKEAGLIKLGRGRGGSVARLPDAKIEEIAPPPPTKQERMAVAREVKGRKQREKEERDAIRERVIEIGKQRHPEADEIVPGLYGKRWYVEVWKGSVAHTDFFPEELLL